MLRKLQLNPIHPKNNSIEFEWDSDTGEIGGKDANEVLTLVKYAIYAGEVSIDLIPTSVEITNPRKDVGQMAAILSQRYQLPEDLMQAIPRVADDGEIPTFTDENGNVVALPLVQ